MLIEDISTSQILTAVMFIIALLALQIYVTRNKNTLKGKWVSNQRIQLTHSTRLGPTEKLQIIKVDEFEYLYFFSKGNKPVILPMIPTNGTSSRIDKELGRRKKPNIGIKQNLNKVQAKVETQNTSKSDQKIIQAISLARKQNPKVSFE